MYTIVIETPTLLNRTFLWSSGKVSNRISTELYRFSKRLGISRSCSDISSAKSKTTTCNQVYESLLSKVYRGIQGTHRHKSRLPPPVGDSPGILIVYRNILFVLLGHKEQAVE